MKNLMIIFAVALFCLNSFAQAGVSVGSEVQYQCFCFGQEWVRAKVERIDGNNLRVRFGNMDNQVITLPANSPKLKLPNAASNSSRETIPMTPQQNAFNNEVGKYINAVRLFAHYYDSRYPTGGGSLPGKELWQTQMMELADLDRICRTRYPGMTDWNSPNYLREGQVEYRFGLWCAVAANRLEIEKKARVGAANSVVGMGYTIENLNFGFNEPDNPLRMEIQDIIWNREKWRAAKFAWLKPKYAEYGINSVPANATADVERRAEELWKLAERGAPNRSYKQPPYRDAAVEAFVKNKLAARIPGVQVVKIGLDYRTWVQRASESLVASDDYFNYYKVSYNSYKRGTVLVKIPGRPYCQSQDFVVGQGKGLIDAGIGGSGTFMRCE